MRRSKRLNFFFLCLLLVYNYFSAYHLTNDYNLKMKEDRDRNTVA